MAERICRKFPKNNTRRSQNCETPSKVTQNVVNSNFINDTTQNITKFL